MQEVTGLLQHELQQSTALLETIYCHHAYLLLQDAISLDVLLCMLPLFKTDQQTAVYQALHACLHATSGAGMGPRAILQFSCLLVCRPQRLQIYLSD